MAMNLKPSTLGYDFAKDFLFPTKSKAETYSPLQRDFATMLNVEFHNNVAFHSGRNSGMFDYKAYLTHFFLGLFLSSVEIVGKKSGVTGANWYFDKATEQLKMFLLVNSKTGKKKLIMKCIDFSPNVNERLIWPENDLKNVALELQNSKVKIEDYDSVESHWYQVTVENLAGPKDTDVVCPFIFFTLTVENVNPFDTEFVRKSTRNRKKVVKNFISVELSENSLSSLQLGDYLIKKDEEVRNSDLYKFILKMVDLFKSNIVLKVGGGELGSMHVISQCAFVHGILITLQKKMSLALRVEETSIKNPAYVIKVTKKSLRDSWEKIINNKPILFEFLRNSDKIPKKYRETVLIDQVVADRKMEVGRVIQTTFSDELVVVYMNFNADKLNFICDKSWTAKPMGNTFEVVQDMAAASLENMDKPGSTTFRVLQQYVESEFGFIKQVFVPAYKKYKLKYLSRYLTGFLASSRLSERGYVFDITLKNPNELEKERMKSFLLKSKFDNLDIIFNIYEQEELKSDEFKYFFDKSSKRRYPKSSILVTATWVIDFFTAFHSQSFNRPEYRSSMFHASTLSLVPRSEDDVDSDFILRQMKHLNLPMEMIVNADKTRAWSKVAKRKIKEFFDLQAKKIVNTEYEMQALIHGLMHHVRTVNNFVDMRKNVFQIGFIDDAINIEQDDKMEKKLFLLNFAFGTTDSAIDALDETRDLLENKRVIKGQEKIETILNIALVKDHADENLKTFVMENDLLSVLGKCSRIKPFVPAANQRKKRDAICSSDEVQHILDSKKEIEEIEIKSKSKFELSLTSEKYLENLNRLSAGIMYGLMAKNLFADIIHGNIGGVAMNAGFLLANVLTDALANKLLTKSAVLLDSEKFLLGTVLRAGAPFLRRLPSFAFVGFDLYNSIKAYKNNQSEALINIGVDTSYIAIDLAETAIEVTEAFGIIEGVSAVTGPIGWTVGAALLLGADFYHSIKKAWTINSAIHLTKMERFSEGFRAFFGMDPESHVQNLMNEKKLLSENIVDMASFLKQHPTIKRYIFPVNLEEGQTSCVVNLQSLERYQLARSIPFDSSNSKYKYFCIPNIYDNSPTNQIVTTHYCKNAIGLEDPNNIKSQNVTYIHLATGNDVVVGTERDPNIFDVTGSGYKQIKGGKNDDVFIIRNKNSTGIYDGDEGQNFIDFSNLNTTDNVFIKKNWFNYKNNNISLHGINGVIGRSTQPDIIICWCGLHHIELQGGNNNSMNTVDKIIIHKDDDCFYNVTTRISGSDTHLINRATSGHFIYSITMLTGSLYLNVADSKPFTVKKQLYHEFLFDYAILDFQSLHVQTSIANNISRLLMSLNPTQMIFLELPFTTHDDIDFYKILFKDGSKLHVTKTGHGIVVIKTIDERIDQIVDFYAEFVSNSAISLILHSELENKTATITRSLTNDRNSHAAPHYYSIDIHYNNPEHDHSFHRQQASSVVHESVLVVKAKEERIQNGSTKLIMKNITVDLGNNKHKFILDLDEVETQIKLHLPSHQLQIKAYISNYDVILTLMLIRNETSTLFGSMTLLNAMKCKSFRNVVIRKVTPMILKYDYDNMSLSLEAVPLHFDETKNLILISPQDDLDYEMKIIFNHSLEYIQYFHINHTDLVLSNAFATIPLDVEHVFTLIVKDF